MKKLSLFFVLGAMILSLFAVGCSSSSSSGLGGSSIGGGASKAPIANGYVWVNGSYVGRTDADGNFSIGSVNFGGADRVEVQIRGGSTPFFTYPDDQVVLDGYLFKGDSTVYLSAFSMMQKRWMDSGLSREEAQGRVTALFNMVSSLVGFDFGGVEASSNPTESNAYEVAQQAVLAFLGVNEQTSSDIGTALDSAIGNTLTDSTSATDFNADMTALAIDIRANRENILAAASAARSLSGGSVLSVDATKIKAATTIGLNPWHSLDGGDLSQAGTIFLDAGGAAQNLDFFFDKTTAGADSGGGLIEVLSDASLRTNNTGSVLASALPAIPGGTFYVGGSVTALTAGTTELNNTHARLVFNPSAFTETQKRALLDDVYTVRFYAGADRTLTQSFKIRFTYASQMGLVSSVDTAAFGTGLTGADFNFHASDRALYIDKDSRINMGTGAGIAASIKYTGKDNLDSVFMRFVAPSGFKFDRTGWSKFYSNIDLYNLTATDDSVAGGTLAVAAADTQVKGTGPFYLVASSDQPVGKKTFIAQVIDKNSGTVLAVNGSDDDPIYFTTDDSLTKIAGITLSTYGGDTTPTYADLQTRTLGPDLAAFGGTVTTWGTLSGQATNCTSVDEVTDSTWKLSVWAFNEDDVSGFMYGSTNSSTTASDWTQNLDVVHDGTAVDNIIPASIVAANCTLTVDPGANSLFKAYYHAGRFNVDKISVKYDYEPTDTTESYSKASNTLDFK